MIERIRLVNFKSHADTTIEFGRLTALIGPNSAGKTSILESLCQVHANHAGNFLRFVKHGESKIHLTFQGSDMDEGEQGWEFQIVATRPSKVSSKLRAKQNNVSKNDWIELQGREKDTVLRRVGSVKFLKLIGYHLESSSYSEKIPPSLENDGLGLASAVAYLMTSEPDLYAKLVAALKSVVPSVERVLTRPARARRTMPRSISVDDKTLAYEENQEVIGHELMFDMTGGKKFPASAMSEGTLITLGILTAIYSPESPNLILIDDIEQGLHPKAQRELIGQLRKILEQRPELQIVVTSHSPYIVDELEADEVWVLVADKEGTSHARRLSDHPEADRALEVLTTGEFWSAEGEDWILKNGK